MIDLLQLTNMIHNLDIEISEYELTQRHTKEFKNDHVSYLENLKDQLIDIERKCYFEELERIIENEQS